MQPGTREPPQAPLWALFFLSGVSALAYEVIWTRILSLVFGVTAYAVATVLAAYMGGLALGSYLAGRWADRRIRPLRDYGVLEVAIGAAGALTPLLLAALHHLTPGMQRAAGGSATPSAALAFATSFAALLVPTTLMGATLPVLAKHVARRAESLGRRVGLLYAVNTLGGVAGSFLCGFVMIELLGVSGANAVAIGVNLAIGIAALVLDRWGGAGVPALPGARAAAPEPGPATIDAPSRNRLRGVTLGFALAGATSLAYEVLLTRLGIFFLWDTTIYSFATMLTTFLAGLALGSLLLSLGVDRWRPLFAVFGLLEIGIGTICLALLLGLGPVAHLREALMQSFYRSGELAVWRYLGLKFIVSFLLFLPPTVLMGGTFPIVNRIVARHPAHLGRSLGRIYAANTIGSIVGALVAGFALVPGLGLMRGILAVAIVNLLLGVALIAAEPAWRHSARLLATGAAALAFALVALAAPTGRPAVSYSDLLSNPQFRRELLFSREGREATLAVLRDPTTRILELNINGQSTAFTSYMDLQVHRALGHLPALCHPEPRSALVIGFGFGLTCRSILAHGVRTLDCVELVPEERESATFFDEVNQGVLADPRFRFVEGDGRNFVLVTDRRYDLISFNAIHPKLSASLYTLDFYRLCRERLTPEGVIAAWLPINFLSTAEFTMLIRTFRAVFPEATLWYLGPGHAILIGTLKPHMLDHAALADRLERPAVRADLAESNLDDPDEILSLLVLDAAGVAALAGDGPLNTDNHPRVEFGISFGTAEWYASLQAIYRLALREPPPLTGLAEPAARARLERFVAARRHWLYGSIVQGVGVASRNAEMVRLGIDRYRKAVELVPESRNLKRLLEDKVRLHGGGDSPPFGGSP